jgi:hypothetical protein
MKVEAELWAGTALNIEHLLSGKRCKREEGVKKTTFR